MKRDYERSLADLNEAIRLDPTDANSFNIRGGIHLLKGQWKAALSDFSETIRLDPQDGICRVNRSLLYNLLAEYDKADEDQAEANRLKYTSSTIERASRRWVLVNLRFGHSFRFARSVQIQDVLPKVIAECDEAIRRNPSNGKAYTRRGWARLIEANYDKAIGPPHDRWTPS